MTLPARLIDTHVHLWNQAHIDRNEREWLNARPAICIPHELNGRSGKMPSQGFLFVQAEANHSKGDWRLALEEADWVAAHCSEFSVPPLLGMAPWVPVNETPEALERYLDRLRNLSHVKQGVPTSKRLLVSSRMFLAPRPLALLSEPDFIRNIQILGHNELAFEVGLNAKQAGSDFFQDLAQLAEKAPRTTLVLDHMLCPPLSRQSEGALDQFLSKAVQLASFPNIYWKLSGLMWALDTDLSRAAFASYAQVNNFSEVLSDASIQTILALFKKLLSPILESFGPKRIMYGSNWPMDKADHQLKLDDWPIKDEAKAFNFSLNLYVAALKELGVNEAGLEEIFYRTATRVYKLGQV